MSMKNLYENVIKKNQYACEFSTKKTHLNKFNVNRVSSEKNDDSSQKNVVTQS